MQPQKQKGPRFYSSDELDRMDKEMSHRLHAADKTLANASLDQIQEHGIDSPDEQLGHIGNVFFNHKIVQPTKHQLRKAILAGLIVFFAGLFILWALGIFLLPGLNFGFFGLL